MNEREIPDSPLQIGVDKIMHHAPMAMWMGMMGTGGLFVGVPELSRAFGEGNVGGVLVSFPLVVLAGVVEGDAFIQAKQTIKGVKMITNEAKRKIKTRRKR